MALATLAPGHVNAINRYVQTSKVQTVFVWNVPFHLPKGDLLSILQFPIAVEASGLPNKVTPNEVFSIPFSIAPNTGFQVSIGGYEFSLDSIIQNVLSNIPQEIDLRPYVQVITCKIADLILDPLDYVIACGPDGKGGVVKIMLSAIRLSLRNELIVTAQTSGSVDLPNAVVATWFGQTPSFRFGVSSSAQRGEQLTMTLMSSWTVSLYFDFQQSLYDNPIAGGIFKKIRDSLHMPWQRPLGAAKSSAAPSMHAVVLIPDFQFTASQTELNVPKQESASIELRTTSIDEFDDTINLALNQVPQGIGVHFANPQIAPQSSTTLTLAVSDSALAGDYSIPVVASGGGKTHTLSIMLHVSERGLPVQVVYGGMGLALVLFLVIAGVMVARSRRRSAAVRGPPSAAPTPTAVPPTSANQTVPERYVIPTSRRAPRTETVTGKAEVIHVEPRIEERTERFVSAHLPKYCDVCGRAISVDDRFCDICGTPMHRESRVVSSPVRYCDVCGRAISVDDRFCDICGARLHRN